jgi:hypothetical protein
MCRNMMRTSESEHWFIADPSLFRAFVTAIRQDGRARIGNVFAARVFKSQGSGSIASGATRA